MKATDWAAAPAEQAGNLPLEDGARVGVVGSGPAGSLFAYFLLDLAERYGRDIAVDLYDTRDFTRPAPVGCNMCGGIISESLVQALATEGIELPPTVIQRGIDSYVLHTDVGTVRIETPLHEKRIGAVYRGGGPRDIKVQKWGSFDAHLQSIAVAKGARVVNGRVDSIALQNGRPRVAIRGGEPQAYDLLVGAVGVNTGALRLFEELGTGYTAPGTTKTLIREYQLGEATIARCIGSSMHVFLLNIPRLEFAAVIPKGDYVSVCLLGDEIDDDLVQAFLASPEVQSCFPPGWQLSQRSCQCAPRINVVGTKQPYADRIVFVGDCAVTRLYKDGIGAAYRTAKAAARTALFEGVSAESFRRSYEPVCKAIARDNAVGKVTFGVTRIIQKLRIARRAVLRMTAVEQRRAGRRRRMSSVLWDLFTGSSSYTDVFLRTLHPVFLARLLGNVVLSVVPGRRSSDG